MDCLRILPKTLEVLKEHRAKPVTERVEPPIMVLCSFKDGAWDQPKLVPYQNISLDPSAKIFHYSQGIFEGLKAYDVADKGPSLFRPEENYKRFISSSDRLDIPKIPKDYFMDSLYGFVKYAKEYIPKESEHSLYLRPFIIASEPGLSANSAKEFKFIIIGKVSEPYTVNTCEPVFLEKNCRRVAKGGMGSVKACSNYAAGLKIDRVAKEQGYNLTLWLDSAEGKYLEELSGMSFFYVVGHTLYTPLLNDSILPGITRMSIITLALSLGYGVIEKNIEMQELEYCDEMFACGTTATIMPISYLGGEKGPLYLPKYTAGPITSFLKTQLLGIQEGRFWDPFKWVVPIPTL